MNRKAKIKLAVVAVLVVVATVILVQNTAPVETRLLFAAVTMPRAILLLVTLAIGFVAGLVAAGTWGRKQE